MPRVSREDRERNHRRVLREASRMLRERGVGGVSVPEVMAAAGMTHGGFYKHFASKEDLLARAGEAAVAERQAALDARLTAHPDRAGSHRRFVGDYLSTGHRDHPADGCAIVALAADAARRPEDDALHRIVADGVRGMADSLGELRRAEDGDAGVEDGTAAGARDPEVLAELATLVGAALLARATSGDDISDRILEAARDRLTGG